MGIIFSSVYNNVVLPSLNEPKELPETGVHERNRAGIYRKFVVRATPKVRLQTHEYFLGHPEPNQDTRYVVFLIGNGETAKYRLEQIKQGVYDELGGGRNVMFRVFDYRGVCASTDDENTPQSIRNLVSDSVFQVKDLLKTYKANGIKPEHVTVFGHSLGGGIATNVVNQLHQEGIRVKGVFSRTFSALTTVAKVVVEEELNSCFSLSSTASIDFVDTVTDRFTLDAIEAYLKIPKGYKMLYNARQDDVIREKASLYTAAINSGETENVYLIDGGHNNPADHLYLDDGTSVLSIVNKFMRDEPALHQELDDAIIQDQDDEKKIDAEYEYKSKKYR